jgi:hypothetical protein
MRRFPQFLTFLLTAISVVVTTTTSSATPLDFRIGDTVEMNVDASNPEQWKITLDYDYHGPSLDLLSYEVILLDYTTCTDPKITPGPIYPDSLAAITSNDDGSFTLNLDVDVLSLQQSENDFIVQTEATDSTELTAFVEFCARVNLVGINNISFLQTYSLLLSNK